MTQQDIEKYRKLLRSGEDIGNYYPETFLNEIEKAQKIMFDILDVQTWIEWNQKDLTTRIKAYLGKY